MEDELVKIPLILKKSNLEALLAAKDNGGIPCNAVSLAEEGQGGFTLYFHNPEHVKGFEPRTIIKVDEGFNYDV